MFMIRGSVVKIVCQGHAAIKSVYSTTILEERIYDNREDHQSTTKRRW